MNISPPPPKKKIAFEKYKPRGLFSEFYGMTHIVKATELKLLVKFHDD